MRLQHPCSLVASRIGIAGRVQHPKPVAGELEALDLAGLEREARIQRPLLHRQLAGRVQHPKPSMARTAVFPNLDIFFC